MIKCDCCNLLGGCEKCRLAGANPFAAIHAAVAADAKRVASDTTPALVTAAQNLLRALDAAIGSVSADEPTVMTASHTFDVLWEMGNLQAALTALQAESIAEALSEFTALNQELDTAGPNPLIRTATDPWSELGTRGLR